MFKTRPMETFLNNLTVSSPVFILVFAGYVMMRLFGWPKTMADNMTTFVFNVGLPALLFRMMSRQAELPSVDPRLLIAFFGSCFIIFGVGRIVAWKAFQLDGVGQSIFGIGSIFSANVLLGLPLAKILIGDDALPSVALVLVFNALILWTLVSVSIEWARHGNLSVHGLTKTFQAVIRNPMVVSIISGTLFGQIGVALPAVIEKPIDMIAQTSIPLSLLALGMSMTEYSIRAQWKLTISMTVLKLICLPVLIYGVARRIGLPDLETRVVVLLGSVGVGANVFLMARQFKTLEATVASALLLSTFGSAISMPLLLAVIQ